MTIHIRATVSGGVTGYRTSLLKKEGKIAEYATRQEAQADADRLNANMNHAHARANFSYTVIEEEEL